MIKRMVLIISMNFTIYTYEGLQIKPLQTVLNAYPYISCLYCFGQTPVTYKPFNLAVNQTLHPHQTSLTQSYILTIPQAYIQSRYGFVTFDNVFIKELIWKEYAAYFKLIKPIPLERVTFQPGRVAIISQLGVSYYYHWIVEVLCRLALLELSHVEYDWLYTCQIYGFMKDSLDLWGIDKSKIIAPTHDDIFIQADQVIVPSLISHTKFSDNPLVSCFPQPELLEYVRQKLLNAALQRNPTIFLAKRIFISRTDAPKRKVINEDEVFAKFKEKGFVKYELAKLSLIDQIHLFHNAEIIVSPHGSGLTNIIFCKTGTKIIELFQGLFDACFCYLAQHIPGLEYTAIATTDFIPDYSKAFSTDTCMPLTSIQNVIHNHIER